jgi:hypothetical protein
MIEESSQSNLIIWIGAALLVSASIGLLRKSRLRLLLMVIWSLLPALVFMGAWLSRVIESPEAWSAALGFFGTFVLFTLPAWMVLTILSFSFARWFRDCRAAKAG